MALFNCDVRFTPQKRTNTGAVELSAKSQYFGRHWKVAMLARRIT